MPSRPIAEDRAQDYLLIIEGDSDIAAMLQIYFTRQGYDVVIADRGKDALELARQRTPDLIIMDVTLPDIDGFEVCNKLKSDPETGNVPVIILTTRDERSDRIRGLELGAEYYMIKPFNWEELRWKVRNRIRRARSLPRTARSCVARSITRRMMIVEDDPDISNMLRIYFQAVGYEVAVAQRGEDALEMCWQELPHVIILDIMLPDMDGYDVCRELRGNLRTSHVSVIFLTQKDERSDKIHGLELGADDYMTKPFDLEELKLRVQNASARVIYENRTNPTTGLPGYPIIERRLTELLFDDDWALLFVSINRFESFCDIYGFVAGEELLRFTAMVLGKAVDSAGTPNDFVGHVNRDRFLLITDKNSIRPVLENIQHRFDMEVEYHYDWATRQRGYLAMRDEAGHETKVDLMSLSIGVVTADDGPFSDIREIGKAAAEARCMSRSFGPSHPGAVNSASA